MAEHSVDEPFADPETIGPYRILRRLGVGGMGVAYEAEQRQPVRRHVALKVIKLGMDTEQVVARFEAERQALAVMDHPGIAKVFDGGSTETGRPYFAMELVKGVPITEYCDTHRLSTDARLRLFVQVCGAVQHAHQKGVIHRDLKPSNVLVTLQGGVAQPKVIDFGIAKAIGQDLTGKTLVTHFGQLLGTPEYMSPEQAEMSGVDVDTRTDIYALGVMLYEILVGVRPHEFGRLADPTVAYKLRQTAATAPSTRLRTLEPNRLETVADRRRTDPRSLRRLLKGDLDWVVLKCLEKDRTRRYDSAAGLAEELGRVLSDRPVVARPPSTVYRLRKFGRRNRLAVTAATTVFLAMLSGGTAAFVGMVRARSAEAAAAREAETAQQVTSFLVDLFQVSEPGQARGNSVTAREILDQGATRIRSELVDQPDVQGRLMAAIGEVYRKLGLYSESETLLEEAVRVLEERDQPRIATLVPPLNALATLYEDQGRFGDAEALYRRALDVLDLEAEEQPELQGMLTNNLGRLASVLGRHAEAEDLYLRALTIHEETHGTDHPQTATTLGNLAVLYRKQGRFEEAEALQRRTLGIAARTLGTDHPTYTTRLTNLGALLVEIGKSDAAEPLYAEALEIDERVMGPDHPYVATDLLNLAALYIDQARLEEAEALLNRALDIDQRAYGSAHPAVAGDLLMIARLRERQGQVEEAEESYETAKDMFVAALGSEHPQVAVAYVRLSTFHLGQRRFVDAESNVERALGILRRDGQLADQQVAALALHTLAIVKRETSQLLPADSLFRQALDMRERILGPEHPRVAETLEEYAALLRLRDQPGAAADMEARAGRIRDTTAPS
jgi:serine/threonine protein kinase/tetratricopeptide (TPR) repeat protein